MTTRTIQTKLATGAGRELREDTPAALIGVLTETVPVTAFTDGGSTAGTYQMLGALPAGAVMVGGRVLVPAGFAGDTSATIQIGDGSTVNRFSTGTPSVFTTAPAGIEIGVPSGNKLLTAPNRPTITVTTGADFTACKSNAQGVVTVSLYYILE